MGYSVRVQAILDASGIKAQLQSLGKTTKFNIDTGSVQKAQRQMGALGNTAQQTYSQSNRAASATKKQWTGVLPSLKQGAQGFGSITKKVVQFGASTAIIRGVGQGVGGMVKSVTALDGSLTEMRKVSSLSGDGLKKFTTDAFKAGQGVARTGREMVEASTEFAKAGFDEKQALMLGKTASMFQNIADTELTAGESASFIISQMKGFNIEAKDSMKIIDSVNEVSNQFAVGSNDLQLALTKTSSAMGTLGNSYDETIGIVTAGTEIMTGQPSKVGRGLRTIGMNIAAMAKDGERWTAASGKVDVALRDQQGELRSTFDIMKDLQPQWKNLSNAEKTAVAQSVAGKNQFEVFTATMNNFDTAIKAANTSMHSSGSANKENAKVLDSVQGHVQKLKTAWENFAYQTLGTNVVKGFLDVGSAILNGLASPIGQAIIKLLAVAAPVALVTRSFMKLRAMVQGMSALGAIKTIFMGNTAAMNADTAATERNTVAKQRNVKAGAMQNTMVGKGAKGLKATRNIRMAETALMGTNGMPLMRQAKMTKTKFAMPVGGITKMSTAAKAANATTKTLGATLKGAGKSLLGFVGINPYVAAIAGAVALGFAIKKIAPSTEKSTKKIKENQKAVENLNGEIDKLEAKRSSEGLDKDEKAKLDTYKSEKQAIQDINKEEAKRIAKSLERQETGQAKPSASQKARFGTGETEEQLNVNELLEKRENLIQSIGTAEAKARRARESGDDKEAARQSKIAQSEKERFKDVNKSLNKRKEQFDLLAKSNPEELQKRGLKDAYDLLGKNSKSIKDGMKGIISDAEKFQGVINGIKDGSISKEDAGDLASGIIPDAKKLAESEAGMQKLTDDLQLYQTALQKGQDGTKAFGKVLGKMKNSGLDPKVNKKGQFISDPTQMKKEAKAAGLTVDAYQELIKAKTESGEVQTKFDKGSMKQATADMVKQNKAIKDADGNFTMSRQKALEYAQSLGMTTDQANMFAQQLTNSGNRLMDFNAKGTNMTTQLAGLGKELGVAKNKAGELKGVDLSTFTKGMKDMGASEPQIKGMVKSLNGMKGVKFSGSAKEFDKWGASAEKADKASSKLLKKAEKKNKLKVDASVDDGPFKKLDKTISKVTKKSHKVKVGIKEDKTSGAKDFFNTINKNTKKGVKAKVSVEVKNKKDLKQVEKGLQDLPPDTKVAVTINGKEQIMTAEQAIKTLQSSNGQEITSVMTVTGKDQVDAGTQSQKNLKGTGNVNLNNVITTAANGLAAAIGSQSTLLGMTGKTITNTITTIFKTIGKKIAGNADGKKKGEAGGLSWVGEEGPELIVSKDSAYLAGQSGWELTTLGRNDVVYTADETKRMLGNIQSSGSLNMDIPRYAKGRKYLNPDASRKGKQTKQGKKDEKKANKFDNWLDTQQYSLDMDKISEATYMARLKKKIAKNKSTTKEQYRDAMRQLHDYKKEAVESAMEEYTARAEYSAKGFTKGKSYLDKARKARKISSKEYKEMLNELYQAKITNDFKQFESGKKSYASLKKQLEDYVKKGKITYSQYYEYLDDLAESAKDKELARLEKLQEKEDAKKQLLNMYVGDNLSAIDKQIEALEKQNETQQMGNELAEKEADLARAKTQRVKVYREGVGFIYERDTTAIKEAQQALKDFESEKQIKDLENLKEQWQSLQDYIDNWDHAQEQLNLEQQAGTTMDKLVAGMGTDLEQFRSLYSLVGGKVEGYADIIAMLENAETKDAINKLLGDDGKIDGNLLSNWFEYNNHDWELDPNRGVTARPVPKITSPVPTIDKGKTSTSYIPIAKKGEGTTTIHIQEMSLPNVQKPDDFMKEFSKLQNKVIQDSRTRT